MVTPLSLIIGRCGLSQSEAADYLDVRLDTLKSWATGRNPTPFGVIEELRVLYHQIDAAVVDLLDMVDDLGDHASPIDFGQPDELGGWPTRSVRAAVIGVVAALAPNPVTLDATENPILVYAPTPAVIKLPSALKG